MMIKSNRIDKIAIMKFISILLPFFLILSSTQDFIVHAQDFSGEEEYYENFCASPRENSEEVQICKAFKEYMSKKAKSAQAEVNALNDIISSLQNDVDAIESNINQYNEIINQLNKSVDQYENSINKIKENLISLEDSIDETEYNINKRNKMIKERMLNEQAGIGVNIYIDIIMGSKDMLDLIRNAEGIRLITENDQEEILLLEKDKEKLSFQKQEQERLKQEEIDKQQEIMNQKEIQEQAKQQQEILLDSYRSQEAELIQQKRDAQTTADAVQSAVININLNEADSIPEIEQSGEWLRPVPGGYNAHTFYYPWGTFHAGADFNADVYTPIQAPISGIIVYSSNPYPTYSGYYPGNWDGFPAGGGNTMHMIGQVDGVTYGISFFHMAQENWITYPGQNVMQGQVIGYTGKTGSTSGPHLHLEVINLGSISMAEAISRFQSTLDFAWGTGWYSESTSCNIKGSTPCREQPEKFFGW